jgi:serine phosphatase RsbU (regulator of sigma subunit)/HAMP domain-containing protein
MFRTLGIKQKFVSLALALLASVALFILIFFPYRQQVQMSEYLQQKVFVISNMVAHSTTSGLLFDDVGSVKTYLDILKTLEEVQFALIYKDGKKFSDYREDLSKVYQSNVNGHLSRKDEYAEELEDVMIASVPVMSEKEVIGRVVVGITRKNLKTDVTRSRTVAIAVGLAVLALGGLVFFWQTTRIVKPLLGLERASRKVAAGEFNVEVTAKTGDEVEVLANGFNVMVANIKSSIEEIRNKNTALLFQQELIEEFNKRLTDSIQYAKRIQSAILPSAEAMDKTLPPHFSVFKPKDVVSGDFFWYSAVGDKSVLAVVDCTGHGVPGAFMSMIGNTLLNDIVNQRKITSPGAILDALNGGVRLALKQDGDSMLAKDGMDVCICVIDRTNVVFAGAGRPLFVVGEDGVVNRIKGDSMSIGGRQKERKEGESTSFKDNVIPITPKMAIYLTSDGFADQNNETGLKFGTPRLTDLIGRNYNLSVDEQRKHFVKALHDHQGQQDQRDDITLVGVRFT